MCLVRSNRTPQQETVMQMLLQALPTKRKTKALSNVRNYSITVRFFEKPVGTLYISLFLVVSLAAQRPFQTTLIWELISKLKKV